MDDLKWERRKETKRKKGKDDRKWERRTECNGPKGWITRSGRVGRKAIAEN